MTTTTKCTRCRLSDCAAWLVATLGVRLCSECYAAERVAERERRNDGERSPHRDGVEDA